MLSERDVSAAIGGTAYSTSGDKIGTVEHFFVDDRTGVPSWVAVSTGLFGTRHSIVPAADAVYADGGLRLPVTADAVKGAPHLEGEHLGPEDEARLRRHYGLEPLSGTAWTPTSEGLRPPGATDDDVPTTSAPSPAAPPPPLAPTVSAPPPAVPPVPHAAPPVPPPPAAYHAHPPAPPVPEPVPETAETAGTTGMATPAGDGTMVRSEEQLRVATERTATTRVRLVKYVVTEEVQITVPIRREEIRVEEVPLDGADGAVEESLTSGDTYGAHSMRPDRPAGDGLPDEVVLHTERPVVTVEVVPVERVRLRVETVEGQERVTEQVQRERITVDETPPAGSVSSS